MVTEAEEYGCNKVVLIGEVTSPVVSRELADGSVVSTFDVMTETEWGRSSVPVSIEGVPAVVVVGVSVCVVGYVRRRFFRSGQSVTSRTEVVAHVISPSRRKATVKKLLSSVVDDLSEFL